MRGVAPLSALCALYVAPAGLPASLSPAARARVALGGAGVSRCAGPPGARSVCGRVSTLLPYPLSPLGVPAALWILKAVTCAAALGIVGLVWRAARLLGRDPLPAVLFVGLNPLLLVHDVGGAHNETLVVLVTMAGIVLFLGARRTAGAAVATAAAGIKASAAIVVPYLVVASRPRVRAALLAAVGTAVAVALLALIGFGGHALDALGILSSNQGRSSRWSFPYKTAQLLGAILPGGRLDYRDPVRAAYGAGL